MILLPATRLQHLGFVHAGDSEALHGTLHRPLQILHVEDSPSDVAMTLAALREGHIANDIYVASEPGLLDPERRIPDPTLRQQARAERHFQRRLLPLHRA